MEGPKEPPLRMTRLVPKSPLYCRSTGTVLIFLGGGDGGVEGNEEGSVTEMWLILNILY